MSCNSCKKKENFSEKKIKIQTESNSNLLVKILIFFFTSLIISILIIPITNYVLFKTIVLDKSIDIFPLMKRIYEVLMGKACKEDFDDEYDEFYDEENLELIDGYYQTNEDLKIVRNN